MSNPARLILDAGLTENDSYILPAGGHFPAVPLLALLCSTRCPGRPILWLYDIARRLRDRGVAVIGGFHTPMEQEALDLLLRGRQPVVVCPARGLSPTMRPPAAWRTAMSDGRLTLATPLPPHIRRASAATAELRNRFVVEHSAAVLVIHAQPQSKTLLAIEHGLHLGKPVFVFADDSNVHLSELFPDVRQVDEMGLMAALSGPGYRPPLAGAE